MFNNENLTYKILSVGKHHEAVINSEYYDELSKYKWCLVTGNGGHYAAWKDKMIYNMLHNVIMKPSINQYVDHIDHNGLNCILSNMRYCDNSQNNANRQKNYIYSTSIYKGVSWFTKHQKWRAQIEVKGVTIRIGLYNLEIEAAYAYDQAAITYFGEFAYINFPENKIKLLENREKLNKIIENITKRQIQNNF